MVENTCALAKIKKLKDNSQDIIFGDFPYALGSTIYIDPKDGKPKYKNAVDFQNKWNMPDHNFWEEFFKECNRVLKHGGRVLAYGIDRQLMLFNYYAVLAGLEVQQSLYWYFIQNFPKSVDLSKQIDKKVGNKRESVGTIERWGNSVSGGRASQKNNAYQETLQNEKRDDNITVPGSPLSKEYEGYKYSISPLKQSLETIMVFQKSTKTNSLINDFMLFTQGDATISPSIWNIDNNRTVANDPEYLKNFRIGPTIDSSNTLDLNIKSSKSTPHEKGRYPSQLFCCELAANMLDKQSGVLNSGGMKKGQLKNNYTTNSNTFNKYNSIINKNDIKKSSGGCSKILKKIDYLNEELSLLNYNSKVSKSERNFGLDIDNNHPTLKPIDLNKKIASLLKTPHLQNVFFPFAGTGSEVIGFEKAGFDHDYFNACELSKSDTEIANQRILAYRNNLYTSTKLSRPMTQEQKQKNLFDFD